MSELRENAPESRALSRLRGPEPAWCVITHELSSFLGFEFPGGAEVVSCGELHQLLFRGATSSASGSFSCPSLSLPSGEIQKQHPELGSRALSRSPEPCEGNAVPLHRPQHGLRQPHHPALRGRPCSVKPWLSWVCRFCCLPGTRHVHIQSRQHFSAESFTELEVGIGASP